MGRRALLLVAAVLLAAVGTGALYLYVTGRTNQVAGMTKVIVPIEPIAAGTTIDARGSQFTTVDVPVKLATDARYLTSLEGLAGLLAAQDLQPLTPVTAGQFGDKVTEKPKIPVPVEKGAMNISVDLDEAARLGTFLKPGSYVTVWVLDPDSVPAGQHVAQVVLRRALVVTTGTKETIRDVGADGTAGDANGSVVTLQVSQDDAGKLLVARQSGELYLTLVGETPALPRDYVGNGANVQTRDQAQP